MRQGIFLPESTFSADSLTLYVHPRAQSHVFTNVLTQRSRSPCQSLVDFGNTKTPSMYLRLDSATQSQLAFPGEGKSNLPREKSSWKLPNAPKALYFLRGVTPLISVTGVLISRNSWCCLSLLSAFVSDPFQLVFRGN